MEGVTGAAWVGMQSLEHAFENNQRLEIKSRQRSTAQPISSSIHGPAAAWGKTTLPTSTAQQVTALLPTTKNSPTGRPSPPSGGSAPRTGAPLPCQLSRDKTKRSVGLRVTALEPQKPDCARSHMVQVTWKALGPAANTSQNSLLGKEPCLTLVKNAQAADKPTEKPLDYDLVATEA